MTGMRAAGARTRRGRLLRLALIIPLNAMLPRSHDSRNHFFWQLDAMSVRYKSMLDPANGPYSNV